MRLRAVRRHGNPLYRRIDYVERLVDTIAVLVLVAAIPLAIYLAGSMHRRVPATAKPAPSVVAAAPNQSAVPDATPPTKSSAGDRASATGVEGTHPNRADMRSAAWPPSTIPMWVDAKAEAAGGSLAAAKSRLAVVDTASGVIASELLFVGVSLALIHRRLNRIRMAQWDAQWEVVEPAWSGRCRR